MPAMIPNRRRFLMRAAMGAAAMILNPQRVAALVAAVESKQDCPMVVIGGGLGGLCCGTFLARHGFPVTVVEQQSIPGGYATAFERDGGRFRFEVSLHGTCLHRNAGARILEGLGVLDRLELVRLPETFCTQLNGQAITVPQQDPEAYIRLLSKQMPAEAAGIRGFVQEMLSVTGEVDRLHRRQGRFFKLLFPLQYPYLWRIRSQTLAQMMDRHVKTPDVKRLLAAFWCYYGLPPSQLSAFYYAVATGDYLKNGSYYVKARSQALSDAMADALQAAGGQMRCESPVKRITLSQGRVSGVGLSDGSVLPARIVVSNASARSTFLELLPVGATPLNYLKRIQGLKPSIASFIVWLGLNQEIAQQVPAYAIHVVGESGPEADYEACLRGDIQKGPFSVTVYDRLFPGYSARGTSTVMLLFLCGYKPWQAFEADYWAGRKVAYNRQKAQWARSLIQRAQQAVIPGLAEMIAVQEVATPLTNWRYTGNCRGAIYGFQQSMDNTYMNRLDNRTPVPGLFLAGAWSSPGGGIVGALQSGERAFHQIIEDLGRHRI